MLQKGDAFLERISPRSVWGILDGRSATASAQAPALQELAKSDLGRAAGARIARVVATALIATSIFCNAPDDALADVPLWATPQATDYAAGETLLRKLAEPQEFLREGLTRREAMVRTSETTGVAIWLDRRLDPTIERTWRTNGEPLEPALAEYFADEATTSARLGDVLYVGPRELALRVEAYCELQRGETKRAPGPRARRLAEKRPFGWEPATEPRAILQRIGEAFELEIVGLDQIPHDLWPGAKLPDADAATQLSLVLAPFDRTFQWRDRGDAIEIGEMDGAAEGRTALNGRLAASVSVDSWENQFPSLAFEKTDGILYATGPWAELVRASRLSTGARTPRATQASEGEKRYTLKVQNQPAGAVVKTLAERMGLEPELSADLVERLKTRVSFDVTEVDREELLRRTLDPVGVSFAIEGTKLILSENVEP